MRRSIAVVYALAVLGPFPLGAQWRELTVGSETELYVRAMQTRGTWNGEPVSMRPYGPKVLDRWMAESVKDHPWASRVRNDSLRNDSLRIWPIRPSVWGSYNSAFPWGLNSGAVWQGKGATLAASAGFGLRWRWISMRVEPVLFRAQNADFTLLGDTTRGVNPFVDDQEPGAIDLPQRFGRSAYQRIDPGQSEVRVDAGPFAIGVSTMSQFWGPGIRHALLMTGNAGGFPHLFLGSSEAWRTPIGRIAGQLIYGRLSPSGYQPSAPTRDRFGSGMVATWQPPSGRGLELGVARFFHREWPSGGLRLGDLTAPLGSVFKTQQQNIASNDNQLATIFARWRAEEDGFEIYGEFGKNDYNANVRDASLEPEHNSAWLLGFAKSYLRDPTVLWMIRGEYANGRITSLQLLGRGQSTFYDHPGPPTEGHTERGRLLGTPLAERSAGFELAVDRWAPWGRAGFTLMQRAMPSDLAPDVTVATARSQWYAEFNATRSVGKTELFGKLGTVLDLNRRPGSDATNIHLLAGARLAY